MEKAKRLLVAVGLKLVLGCLRQITGVASVFLWQAGMTICSEFPGRHLVIYAVKLRQPVGVPELDGSWGIPWVMGASRFEKHETSRRPTPSSDMRGLPDRLLSVLQRDS